MRRLILSLALLAVSVTAPLAAPVRELVAEKARDSYGAELPDQSEFKLSFQRDADLDAVLLSAFWMDRATGQFLANAVLPDGKVRRLQGLAVLNVTVPVPVRRMLPGEIVTESDLQMIDIPHARLGAFAQTDETALIGKEVRRVLGQGRPIMAQSVMEPLVITRGDKVSIKYTNGKLALTAPGRALDDAHREQEIRIVNLVSNTLVTGIARSEGLVEIIR
jgi:flagellar basal body P-ring formation protein FlgA